MKPILALMVLLLSGCADESAPLPRSNGQGPAPFDPDTTYAPRVSATELATKVDNRYFPAPVGARWVYQQESDEGVERIEIVVEAQMKSVWGVEATVVRDTVKLDGEVIEDTWDWYAQDPAGNVWYLGEDTKEYENGQVVCACGAWTAGVGGALPGVVMLGAPKVGDVYRQEYFAGEAEDLAAVTEVGRTVTTLAGTFTDCIVTRDRSALDLSLDERKFYCPNVGLVAEESSGGRVELLEYSGLPR